MAAKTINVMRGCTLYQRRNSAHWQVRIKLDSGEWYRRTTGTDDLEAARQEALRVYFVARDRAEQNLPQQTRRFRQLANVVLSELDALEGTANWKSIYKHYRLIIKAHLIPYFGAYKVDNLRERFEGYVAWLTEKLGREPATSTLRNHYAALNLIFKKALQLNYVTPHTMPSLKLQGLVAQRGASFGRAEHMKLINKLRVWCRKPSKNKRTNELKALLYDYVLILANTGMRHGEEVLRVKWRHLEWGAEADSQRMLHINAWTRKGRGGGERHRLLVARWTAVDAFKRIHQRKSHLACLTFDELLDKRLDEHVFALRDGSTPKTLDSLFRRFLRENDMELGAGSDRRRTLYSFRHYYATMALTRENPIPINVLAMQMGTSIAMIQKHYSHLQLVDVAEALAGKRWAELASDG